MKKSKSSFNVKDIMQPNAPAGPMPASPTPAAPTKKKKKSSASDVIGQPTPVQRPPNMPMAMPGP